jgi:hypothetical protein
VESLLSNPAVQGGVAPFIAALIVAVVLSRARLGGLAVLAAFATAVWFIAGFGMTPLTITRKIFLLGLAAPVLGVLVDFAFRPTRLGAWALALATAAAALWTFWPVLAQKSAAQGLLIGGTTAVTATWLVGFSQAKLASDGIRAGAAGLALGVGGGVAAILAASLTYGLYGIALGAGSGAFLLPQMISGKKTRAGMTFMLPAALLAGLLAAGTMVLAEMPWYAVLALGLVPVAVRLPLPAGAPVWLQAVLSSLYGFIVAAGACALAWHAGG